MQEFGWIKGTTVKSVNPHHKVNMINKLLAIIKADYSDLEPKKADNKQLHIFSVTGNVKKYHFYVAGIEKSAIYTTTKPGFDYLNEQLQHNNTEIYIILINKPAQNYTILPLNDIIKKICNEFEKTKNHFENFNQYGFDFSYSDSQRNNPVVFLTPKTPTDTEQELRKDSVLNKLIECIKKVVEN